MRFKTDAVLLVTASDGQYDITKKCIDSITSKYKVKTYLLNYGQNDDKMKALGKRCDVAEYFPDRTPITIEMNWGIERALKETDIVFNANNDIVCHPQTIDVMIELIRSKDLSNLSGHIVTNEDELKYYYIDEDYNLFFKKSFVSRNKFKSWLPILLNDFGFDLYSFNAWRRDFFEVVGLPDEKTFNKGIYLWDTDLQYRGALKGMDTFVATSAVYFHECGYTEKNATNKPTRVKLYEDMKDAYFRKWGGNKNSARYKGSQHNEDWIIPYQNTVDINTVLKHIQRVQI